MFFAPEMFATNSPKDDKDKPKPINKAQDSMKRGEKTDIWALGITLYYMLAGQYPCQDAASPLQLRDYIINRPINFDMIKHDEARNLI